MNGTSAAEYAAYTAGRECFERGGRVSDCPYKRNSLLGDIWVDGFIDAMTSSAPILGEPEDDDDKHW